MTFVKLQPASQHHSAPNLTQPFPWRAYLLMLPAVGIVGLLFGGGLVLAVLQSIGAIGLLGERQISLIAYQAALTNPRTFAICSVSAFTLR
ncbi:MAG: hypothetical protein HC840_26225 [Leptolyngbyaceae cyanobacterium RM2_2_4]|nr:hypothetical protein [Leptolyngbyaceae cyanobacterium RM2_2_4]